MTGKFVHLHLHTEYSLLDGVGKIDEYLDRAKELNMKALAITDHGNMFGAVEFYKKAMKRGIKPIIGMEAYVSKGRLEEKNKERYHLILLAKNNTGYKNLMKLSSEGFLDGFYYKPRIDKEKLKEHSEGIIALSACMAGEVPRAINNPELTPEDIDKIVESYIEIFTKENFYIELQENGIEGQSELNDKLYTLAKKHGLEVVGTNDVHYTYHGQDKLQDVLMCIQTGAKIDDEKRMGSQTDELFLKSHGQVSKKLGKYEGAIENTLKIAKECNLVIEFGKFKFPEYKLPEGRKTIKEYLRELTYKGLNELYPKGITREAEERIEYELDIINKMGYEGYFVVVWDFIDFARKENIPIGPGRGSAAGSMVAYALGITQLDPLKYNLIFERFLNPERISMPDIDIDICQERRQEIIDYVTEKYGRDRVAQIITFGTLKARAAIRDVGRALGIPLSSVDKIAKAIPGTYTIEEAVKSIPDLEKLYDTREDLRELIDISRGLENKVRHASIHAAGVVITKNPLTDDIPLYSDSKGEQVSTQYQMKEVEELGILKMDFLGLRNLTILQRCLDYIKEGEGIEIKLKDIPLDGPLVYEALQRGDTMGVFQLESDGVRNLLRKLKPTEFEDIIAVLALYRPGPLGSGMVDDYIGVKNKKQEAKYPHPKLKEVLKETYGVILYQEQVMKIAAIMANYTLGEADLLRRAMGKKVAGIMEENRETFIVRSVENGYTKEVAEQVFYLIEKFAGYGFNKSHSAAYGLIAYWTSYLKEYYPTYFYAALMTSERGNNGRLAIYLEDANKHDIKVALPNIQNVSSKFIVEDGKIRFGMSAIKNLGEGIIEKLREDILENGSYKNFEDLVIRGKRIGLNKKGLEALILSGTLDRLPGNRREKYTGLEKAIAYATRVAKEDEIQQMNLFGEAKSTLEKFKLPSLEEYKIENLLKGEREYLGFYFTGHPLDKYKVITENLEFNKLTDINIDEEIIHKHIKTYGMITSIKRIITKKNKDLMCVFTMEDHYSSISCTVFPREYEYLENYIVVGQSIYLEGTVQEDHFGGKDERKILVKNIRYIEEALEEPRLKVYILIEGDNRIKLPELKKIILKSKGKQRVFIALKDEKGKQLIELGPRYHVEITETLLDEINNLLGKGKLKVK